MDRESQFTPARLIALVGDRLPQSNFYRFCQWLERCQPDKPVIGSTWQVRQESVRFRPWPGMGFPASEIKGAEGAEGAEYPHLPPTIRITFMGLYGVESPLPWHYTDDITQQREGFDTAADFLDIFNHRMIAQYYRIWRKYSYPATLEPGGRDQTTQYLLGLTGLGIAGCTREIAMPATCFLALLPMMMLPGRTAEGLRLLVSLVALNTRATVRPYDQRRIPLKTPVTIRTRQPLSLKKRPVMGSYAIDANGQVLMQLTTKNRDEVQGWLDGGQLHTDLMVLLRVYLGSRLDVRLQLRVERSLIQDAHLRCHPISGSGQLGRTAVMKPLRASVPQAHILTINLGRYRCAQENIHRREIDENGDYRW